MAKKECAHPQCSCKVTEGGLYGKYCSEYCEQAGDAITEVFCECHHPGCRAMHP